MNDKSDDISQKNEATVKIAEEKNESQKSSTPVFLIFTVGCLVVIAIIVIIVAVSLKSGTEKIINGFTLFRSGWDKVEKTEELLPTEAIKPTEVMMQKAKLIANAFTYPGSTVVSLDSKEDSLNLVLDTADLTTAVNQYYLDLANLNKWETGPIGEQTGGKAAFVNIRQSDFSASVNIDEKVDGQTEITVDAYFLDDKIISTFDIPQRTVSLEVTTVPGAVTTAPGSYVLTFSNARKVTADDLVGLTPWDLKIARNEIYARHGRPFVHKDLACYFAKQPWYVANLNYSDSSLSALETSNAVFILNYERSINSPLVDKDSGCGQ